MNSRESKFTDKELQEAIHDLNLFIDKLTELEEMHEIKRHSNDGSSGGVTMFGFGTQYYRVLKNNNDETKTRIIEMKKELSILSGQIVDVYREYGIEAKISGNKKEHTINPVENWNELFNSKTNYYYKLDDFVRLCLQSIGRITQQLKNNH